MISPETVSWLKQLHPVFETTEIAAFHGTPLSDTEYLLERIVNGKTQRKSTIEIEKAVSSFKQDIILCTHSHSPGASLLSTKQLVINLGSVGLQPYVDTEEPAHAISVGTPHAKYCILERTDSRWRFQHISLPYDWEHASTMASEHHRPDWTSWLFTGCAKFP